MVLTKRMSLGQARSEKPFDLRSSRTRRRFTSGLFVTRTSLSPFCSSVTRQDGDLLAFPELAGQGLFDREEGDHLAAYLGEPFESAHYLEEALLA